MDFNRNHYFIAGVVVLMLGLQMRLVDSFILSGESTRFLATRFNNGPSLSAGGIAQLMPTGGAAPRKTLHPPQWLGWALMSVGSVLVLHSLAMPRPTG